ncbi:hypothetical protein Mth01_55680 [Sphaerimonospora thailandensis]|uniref:Uncharacterized protein n=1 Tax=Sphaerimonospora thailandensis TaxID=795644 RepID=A0A8J3REL7_9ACTN|nr:hypothetical protein Mth01_55680 [Sphaerimonospora thailandensis]
MVIFRSSFSDTGQLGRHECGTSSRATLVIFAENSGGSAAADGVSSGVSSGVAGGGEDVGDDVGDDVGVWSGGTVTTEETAAGEAVVTEVLAVGSASPAAQAVAVQAVTPTMVIAITADLGFRKQAIEARYLCPPFRHPATPAPLSRDLAVSRSHPSRPGDSCA